MKDFHIPILYGCIAGLLVLHIDGAVMADKKYIASSDVVEVVARLEGVDAAVAEALESMSFLLTNHVQDAKGYGHGVYQRKPIEFWGSFAVTNYPVISVGVAER